MLAYLRYRGIPYRYHIGMHDSLKGYPQPRPQLFPTFYLTGDAGELQAVTDSTPLLLNVRDSPETLILPPVPSPLDRLASSELASIKFTEPVTSILILPAAPAPSVEVSAVAPPLIVKLSAMTTMLPPPPLRRVVELKPEPAPIRDTVLALTEIAPASALALDKVETELPPSIASCSTFNVMAPGAPELGKDA